MNWAFSEAKSDFSKLLRLAKDEGPQTLMVRGKRVAIVLSAQDYDALRTDKPSLVDHMLSGPLWDDELVEAVNARSKATCRKIDL